jgi:hypothetical protein
MKKICIVRTHISSPNAGTVVWRDDNTYIKYLAYPLEVRNMIMSLRGRAKRRLNRYSVLFYGLRITNEPEIIEKSIQETDVELKEIDKTLAAKVIMIPLDEEQIKQGELVEKLCYALIYKAVTDLAVRVVRLKSDEFSDRSLQSLNAVLDDCENLNFLDNKNISQELNNLRNMLKKPVKEVIEILVMKIKEVTKKMDIDMPMRWKKLFEEIEAAKKKKESDEENEGR